jgi:hypothetical protein
MNGKVGFAPLKGAVSAPSKSSAMSLDFELDELDKELGLTSKSASGGSSGLIKAVRAPLALAPLPSRYGHLMC